MPEDLLTQRKPLDEICSVPAKIISVYSLEKHVWANSNSDEARRNRQPELKTIDEFQLDPVRPFLTDILRRIAAPYDRQRKDNPIGQGYWIQAEFGSGKSHLLCFLAALCLGDKNAWQMIQDKENKAGRGKRESLFQFWEEGVQAKSAKPGKGLFVIVKTLVGVGGGTIGMSEKGRELSAYILDAAKDQLQAETGKNLSLYPAEILADRFMTKDVDRYRNDLRKFLKDPKFFEEDEFEEVDNFLRDIQQNKSPEYKRSCGNKLWRFCDIPLPNLITDLLLGLYGFPYHANVQKIERFAYKAKETVMFTDILVLDQARYLYDLLPTLPLFDTDFNLPQQLVLRVCMDALHRHCHYGCKDLFWGCALASMGEEGFTFWLPPARESVGDPGVTFQEPDADGYEVY